MFLRRQDVLDQFANNFRETEEGQVLFQPKKAKVGLPISWEEYDAVTAAFERRQIIDMAITWVAVLGGGAVGYYQLLVHESWAKFFSAFAVGWIFAFSNQLRNQLGLLMPLIKRREALQEAMEETQRPANR
jgi:hypothetical protein